MILWTDPWEYIISHDPFLWESKSGWCLEYFPPISQLYVLLKRPLEAEGDRKVRKWEEKAHLGISEQVTEVELTESSEWCSGSQCTNLLFVESFQCEAEVLA